MMVGKEEDTDDWLTLKFHSETPCSVAHLSLSLAVFPSSALKTLRCPRKKENQQFNKSKCLQLNEDWKQTVNKLLGRANSDGGASTWSHFLQTAREEGKSETKKRERPRKEQKKQPNGGGPPES